MLYSIHKKGTSMKQSNKDQAHTLINFRSPKHIHQSFDEICRLYSLNRTHVLNRLMSEYIVTEAVKIKSQIEISTNLKNNTSNFEMLNMDTRHLKNSKSTKLRRINQNENWSEPMDFIYMGGNE